MAERSEFASFPVEQFSASGPPLPYAMAIHKLVNVPFNLQFLVSFSYLGCLWPLHSLSSPGITEPAGTYSQGAL